MALKKLTREDTERVFTVPWLVARDGGLFAQEGYDLQITPGHFRGVGALAGGVEAHEQITDPQQIDPNWMHRLFLEQGVDIFCA